jgi:hypothetical protein
MRKLIALSLLSGCGSTLFALTPRSEPVITEATYVQPTYGGYPVTRRELHQQRKKTIVPALIGTVIDSVLTTTLLIAAGDESDEESAAVIAMLGAATISLDIYLIANRATVDDRLEPAVYQPGWQPGWQPSWPQGSMETPSQAPGSGYSPTSPSFSINVNGNCPLSPTCTLPATRIATPPPAPMPNMPVEALVAPND